MWTVWCNNVLRHCCLPRALRSLRVHERLAAHSRGSDLTLKREGSYNGAAPVLRRRSARQRPQAPNTLYVCVWGRGDAQLTDAHS